MTADLAADLRVHVSSAVLAQRHGNPDAARWHAIWAGVAAVKLAGGAGADVEAPAELSAEPFATWFAEGVATARAALSRPRLSRPADPVRFTIRPGGNAAARSCKEDFDL